MKIPARIKVQDGFMARIIPAGAKLSCADSSYSIMDLPHQGTAWRADLIFKHNSVWLCFYDFLVQIFRQPVLKRCPLSDQ